EFEWPHDGKQILELINTKFPCPLEHRIFLFSSPTFVATSYYGKALWVEKHLPQFIKEHRLILGGVKEIAARPRAILIDDKPQNCEFFVNKGGLAFCLPRIWNHKHHDSNQSLDCLERWLTSTHSLEK